MRLIILAALVAAPAAAQSADTVVTAPHGPSVQVATTDLDLASASGRQMLDNRLWRAARDVCRMTSLRDLNEYRLEGRCRDDALARARNRVAVAD